MTVQELIEALQGEDPEAEVHFQYNYGDYWRTTVAPKVVQVEAGHVKWSGYHKLPAVVDDSENEEADEVVLLSA